MAQLKSLRGAVGTYGRVAAGGIVEVTDDEAKKLLKTKRFVMASAEDIAAAQDRKNAELKTSSVGATAGFSAMPEKPGVADRLSQLVESGQIDREKANELVSLQIDLSADEIKNFLETEAARVIEDLTAQHDELEALEAKHADKVTEDEAKFAERTALLDKREQELASVASDLEKRQTDIEAREKAVSEAEKAAAAKSQSDAAAKEKAEADAKAKADKASK